MVLEYINKYKEEIKKCINDLKNKDTFYKQIPNLLTFSRAVGAPFISSLFMLGHPVVGVILTGLLLSTDLFDGKLARKWNVQSKFGADLDAFCDKIMFLGLSLPLIINSPLMLLNFILEGAISLVNVYGRMKGVDTKTVFSGKVKTVFLSLTLIVGYLVQFLNLPVLALNFLVAVTFSSQCIALSNYIKEYKRMINEQLSEPVVDEIRDEEEVVMCLSDESLIQQLRREREFLLGTKEPDIVRNNKRVRSMENEKKSNN